MTMKTLVKSDVTCQELVNVFRLKKLHLEFLLRVTHILSYNNIKMTSNKTTIQFTYKLQSLVILLKDKIDK